MLRTVLLKEKKQRLLTEVKTVEYYFALLSLGSSETFSELRWGGCPGSEHSGDNDDWGWGCHGTCALRTNGFHLIHQWAPLGTEGRKQFFFFFFCCCCKQKSHSALSWILAQEISAHQPFETQVSSGHPPEEEANVFHAVKSVAMCSTVATTIPRGQSWPTPVFGYNPPGIYPCCLRDNYPAIPEANSYSFHIKITSCMRREIYNHPFTDITESLHYLWDR